MPLNHLQSFGSFGNLLRALQEEEEEKNQSSNSGEEQQQKPKQQLQLRSPQRSPRSGGRRPNKPNQQALDVDDDDGYDVAVQAAAAAAAAGAAETSAATTTTGTSSSKKTWLKPSKPHEARLTVVQITDVYTLDNFASLKTMLETIRSSQGPNDTVISMLTGDFLSPYLLSSIDRGQGMMDALAATPIDILIWGNHEADIDHRTVCKHVRNFPGTWINTNMQTHEAMDHQVPYKIVEVVSPDGTHRRKIGLVGVLSDDPKLYAHFKRPAGKGAFGGARIDCPWDTLRKYQRILEDEMGCDVVLPLEHLYVPEDHKTCKEFDFPVILSGHDHHRVDEIVDGTRLIKPGMDGVYATVLEMTWDTADQSGKQPRIRSRFVKTATFAPCPVLKAQTDSAYDVLLPLRRTELMKVPSRFEPLSSVNSRGNVTSMGVFICTLLRDALNSSQQSQQNKDDGSDDSCKVDAVILMGGNIRGGEAYEEGSFFSLEMLEAEIKADEIVGIVPVPGSVLAAGIEHTHAGDPRPGWMQYDEGIRESRGADGILRVTTVGGKPIEPDRIYQVATKISDLGNGQSMPFKEYFTPRPELLPSKGSYFNIQTELMGYFARTLFHRLWDAIGKKIRPKMERVASSPMLRQTDVKAVQASPMLLAEATDVAGIPVQASPMLLSAAADIAGIPESLLEPMSDSVVGASVGGEGSAHSKLNGPAQILKKVESGLRLSVLDHSGDGIVSVKEIHMALRELLRLSTSDENMTLAKFVHDYADVTGTGIVSTEDFAHFCSALPGGIGEYYSKVAAAEEGKDNGEGDDDSDEDEALMF